jgi:DNA topoisomerase-1
MKTSMIKIFILFLLVSLPTHGAGSECGDAFESRSDKTLRLAEEAGLRVRTLAGKSYARELVKIRNNGDSPVYIFSYYDNSGSKLSPSKVDSLLRRLKNNKITIPPAWSEVTIAADARAHIQVRGTDAAGRIQSLYHPAWNYVRDLHKFDHNTAFGRRLTYIRRAIERDLIKHGLPKAKVLAAMVSIMDTTLVRVGNQKSADESERFGLTTLRKSHVRYYDDESIDLAFVGKHGVEHDFTGYLRSNVVGTLDALFELPGNSLFKWVDDGGRVISISSTDFNEYLQGIAGNGFTAKNFRTWWATVLAVEILHGPVPESAAATKREWKEAKELVAAALGNQPVQAEKSYIDPVVWSTYQSNPAAIRDAYRGPRGRVPDELSELSDAERATLRFLEKNRSQTVD